MVLLHQTIVLLTPAMPSDARGTLIEVTVASAQGTETYKVTVVRPLKPPLLWSLVGTPGLMTPAFSPLTANYSLQLPNSRCA